MNWKAQILHKGTLRDALIFLGLLIADLWSKHHFQTQFRPGQRQEVIEGLFELTLVFNKGAAWSMGSGLSSYLFVGFTVLAVAFLVKIYLELSTKEWVGRLGVALILSGAIGNLVDRIRLGHVVDFLHFYYKSFHWPVFNVADCAITVGGVLFGIHLLFLGADAKGGKGEA